MICCYFRLCMCSETHVYLTCLMINKFLMLFRKFALNFRLSRCKRKKCDGFELSLVFGDYFSHSVYAVVEM